MRSRDKHNQLLAFTLLFQVHFYVQESNIREKDLNLHFFQVPINVFHQISLRFLPRAVFIFDIIWGVWGVF